MSNPQQQDEKLDFLDRMARNLEDPDAYLSFLEAKLEQNEDGDITKSGVRSTEGLDEVRERHRSGS